MPIDDVDDSKVVKDVYVHSEISSVVENLLVNPGILIIEKSHVSSAVSSDVVHALTNSSTPTPD